MRTSGASAASKLLVGLVVLVRLTGFLLHTHVQSDSEKCGTSGASLVQESHCLACDLESTAAVEAAPPIVLPSQVFGTFDRVIISETPDLLFDRDASASRGPPTLPS